VANLTRQDGRDFIELAQKVPIRTTVSPFPLARANEALAALREGLVSGAAVLTMT
jgi:propanol-preferring alcohol dehydrogenase